jgi:hypothetical protein
VEGGSVAMMYLNGDWKESRTGKTLIIKNPATDEAIEVVTSGGVKENGVDKEGGKYGTKD